MNRDNVRNPARTARSISHKTVRHVRNSLRSRSIANLLFGMPLSFQRHDAGKLDATYHYVLPATSQPKRR
jgi:hypothetical protein